MKIAPSLLAADFADLKNEIEKVKNADFLHLDIMDGHFVPNISFGYGLIECLRPNTNLLFDVHLMISHPLQYVANFAKAGADVISFHVECEDDIALTIEKIKTLGVKPALVVKPNTPIESVFPYANDLYMVLIMTVEPGFGGQAVMIEQMDKAKVLKEKFPNVLVEVDGGIGRANIEICKEKQVDICVCGTSVFKSKNPFEEVAYLQNI